MNIPNNQLEIWRTIKEQGDIMRIVRMAEGNGKKTSRQLVSNAIRYGKCSTEVYQIIREYFDNKDKTIKKLIA